MIEKLASCRIEVFALLLVSPLLVSCFENGKD